MDFTVDWDALPVMDGEVRPRPLKAVSLLKMDKTGLRMLTTTDNFQEMDRYIQDYSATGHNRMRVCVLTAHWKVEDEFKGYGVMAVPLRIDRKLSLETDICEKALMQDVMRQCRFIREACINNSRISGHARIEEEASVRDSEIRGHAFIHGTALICNNSVIDFNRDISYGIIDGRDPDRARIPGAMERTGDEMTVAETKVGEKGLAYLKGLSVIHSSFDESRGYMARDMRRDIEAGKSLEQIADEYKKSIIENTKGDYQMYELAVLNGLLSGIKKAEGIAVPGQKFEFTDEKKTCQFDDYYTELHRIRALKDIPEYGVKKGDLGGWVESEENLSQKGCCWVGNEAVVCSEAYVEEDAIVRGHATVMGAAWIQGKAVVDGYTVVSDEAVVKDQAVVKDFAIVQGWAQVKDKGMVYDSACLSGEAEVYGEGRVYQSVRLLHTEMVNYDVVKRDDKLQTDKIIPVEKASQKKRAVTRKRAGKNQAKSPIKKM